MTEGDYRTKAGDGGRLQGRRAVTEGDYRKKAGDGGRLQDEESRQLLWDGADDFLREVSERKEKEQQQLLCHSRLLNTVLSVPKEWSATDCRLKTSC